MIFPGLSRAYSVKRLYPPCSYSRYSKATGPAESTFATATGKHYGHRKCFGEGCETLLYPRKDRQQLPVESTPKESIPGQSRHFPEISWELCLCVSFFPQEKATHKQIWTAPIPGTIPKSCLCSLIGFFLARKAPEMRSPRTWNRDGPGKSGNSGFCRLYTGNPGPWNSLLGRHFRDLGDSLGKMRIGLGRVSC